MNTHPAFYCFSPSLLGYCIATPSIPSDNIFDQLPTPSTLPFGASQWLSNLVFIVHQPLRYENRNLFYYQHGYTLSLYTDHYATRIGTSVHFKTCSQPPNDSKFIGIRLMFCFVLDSPNDLNTTMNNCPVPWLHGADATLGIIQIVLTFATSSCDHNKNNKVAGSDTHLDGILTMNTYNKTAIINSQTSTHYFHLT